jgi:peptide/nickel transport system ATP-binding protein
MEPGTRNPEPPPPAPLLAVTDLSVTFDTPAGQVCAVRGLGYDVRPGEVVGIVGETGSGKTVSSLAIMQLLPAHARVSGSVRFEGEELLGRTDAELSRIRGRRIAMIFQDPLSSLTPVYTVGDQIAEAVRIHNRIGRAAALDRAIDLLALVGIANPRARAASFPHELSGGMRQRVMIAMAIANDPALIIADEPTTALDVTIQAQILDVLRQAREATGAAIVLITHDLGIVAGVADRVCVMYAGKPVETGAVEDVFYRPRMPYTLGLLGSIPRLDAVGRPPLTPIEGTPPSPVKLPAGCPFAPRCPMRIERCLEAEPALLPMAASGDRHFAACHRSGDVERGNLSSADVFPSGAGTLVRRLTESRGGPLDAGSSASARRGGPSSPPASTVLEVRDLVRRYPVTKGAVLRRRIGTVHAVDGISFDVREGETLGLVGESGCGKTTTLMEILSLAAPGGGTIAVLGKETSALARYERLAIRGQLQVVFQDPMASLDPRMPVGDIIAEPMEVHGVPPAERASRVQELLRMVGLEPDHASRFPQAFSGGQRQRIAIARALALRPKVLVLDEPVSALDVSVRAGILNLLENLKASFGLSYLFVSHDLAVIRYVADRVAVMYLGRLAEIGDVDTVFGRPAHPYTQALLSAIPLPDPRKERARRRIVLEGDLPNPANPPSGCRFRTRCQKFARELTDSERQLCTEASPALLPRTGDPERLDACHYASV